MRRHIINQYILVSTTPKCTNILSTRHGIQTLFTVVKDNVSDYQLPLTEHDPQKTPKQTTHAARLHSPDGCPSVLAVHVRFNKTPYYTHLELRESCHLLTDIYS